LPTASPGPTVENCLSTPRAAEERHLNLCSGYPVPMTGPGITDGRLSTPASAAEKHLDLFLATLRYVAPAPALLTNGLSLKTSRSAVYSPNLLHSSATYPMCPTASVTWLSYPWPHRPHRRALHVSLVLIGALWMPS